MLEKKYHSPFHILSYFTADFENIDSKKIALIKKQALLEIQLAENQFLVINQSSYSKQHIINLFDKLEKEDLQFHSTIWKNKELLNFIEHSTTSEVLFTNWLNKDSKHSQELIELLATSFQELSRKELRKHQYNILLKGIEYFHDKGFEIREKALKKIVQYYKNFILKKTLTNNTRSLLNRKEYLFLKNKNFFYLLNKLPNEYNYLREEVAILFINFIYYHHKTSPAFCREISKNSLLINCSAEAKKTLVLNSNITKPSTNYNKIARILFLLFIIWRVLSGIGVFDANEKHKQPLKSQFKYQQYTSLESKELIKKYKSYIFENKDKGKNNQLITPSYSSTFSFSNDLNKPYDLISTILYPVTITNNTSHDAVMILNNELGFSQDVITSKTERLLYFSADNQYFFYIGSMWNTARKLDYMHRYPKHLTMNGSFDYTDANTDYYLDTIFELQIEQNLHKGKFINNKNNYEIVLSEHANDSLISITTIKQH